MPHNRTRIWVGLAIAAVTIPAAGRYFYAPVLQEGMTVAEGQGGREEDAYGSRTVANRTADRDYQGELDAVIAKQGRQSPYNPTSRAVDLRTAPLSVPIPNDSGSPIRVASNRTPVATTQAAGVDPNLDTLDDAPPANGGLSDLTVYNIVVDNLSPDDRDNFEKSWALMSPQDRADMLDQFRNNLSSK